MSAKPKAGEHEGAYRPPKFDGPPVCGRWVSVGGQTWRLQDFYAAGGIAMSAGPACPQCHGTGLYGTHAVHVTGQPTAYRSSVCGLHRSRWGPAGPPVMASHEGPDTLNFGANESLEAEPA